MIERGEGGAIVVLIESRMYSAVTAVQLVRPKPPTNAADSVEIKLQ